MKHYFLMAKEVGGLTRIFCAQLEAEYARRSRFRSLPPAQRRQVAGFRVRVHGTIEIVLAARDHRGHHRRVPHAAQAATMGHGPNRCSSMASA